MTAVTGPIMYKKFNKIYASRPTLGCTQHVPRLLLAVPRSCPVSATLLQLGPIVETKAEYSIIVHTSLVDFKYVD